MYAHTHACAFIPVPSYIHTHMHVHLYLYPHACTHICMCIYTCTLLHTHTHTHTCTSIPAPSCIHTHTCTPYNGENKKSGCHYVAQSGFKLPVFLPGITGVFCRTQLSPYLMALCAFLKSPLRWYCSNKVRRAPFHTGLPSLLTGIPYSLSTECLPLEKH